ncbi:leucine-rich repeat neuronal protein 2 [Anthonomus grandis grandis]|uniref:leucine-rich repeat neuronal protein 2 n=1 Tax=Anthonomus grandis grandis TaxID=2921223 RepID=UPI0021664C1A|nr:leucine-rich repeat neuronal protein 2 [Anthonomus grandis grandis]
MLKCYLIILSFVPYVLSESCPVLCTCKWKNGKRTVECMERGLIKIPENADPETQVLDLSVNNLQILPKDTFLRSGLVNLQRVFLKSCRLGQIDQQAFRGVTNLIELDLSSNLLTSIPSNTFQNTPFLRELYLANNPIQKIDPKAFSHLHHLIKLDISGCEIKMVAPRAFEGIEGLESLKINDNHLSELRPHTVEILTKLHGIELHNNPWHCDCRLRTVKEWLTINNIPYTIPPKCLGGPERLIRSSLADLHMDDLACKPELLPVSRFIESTAGENATVACRANAIPPPVIKWFFNGKLLTNNSKFSTNQGVQIYETGKQEKRSILVISNVQEGQDLQEFYCVAENRGGSMETNFTLRVVSRPLGITSLDNGQIAGLTAALAILILLITVVVLILLVRIRRHPYVETKTPRQLEVITVVNGCKNKIISPTKPLPEFNNVCDPPQKPPRSDLSPPNPDLLNDFQPHPDSQDYNGDYTRADSLYPSSLWDDTSTATNNPGFIFDDKPQYPQDYGLPLPEGSKSVQRVWQKGAVPVLPPVTALKRVLNSRNSPDEGYQEGCGTDV